MMKRRRMMHWKAMVTAFALAFTLVACDDDDNPVNEPEVETPTLSNASEVTENSFDVAWTEVEDADAYILDVSTAEDFDELEYVEGFKKRVVEELTITVTDLTPETTYYFRVYAREGTKFSAASPVKQVTTLEAN